jgi:glucokinase
MTPYLAVDLGGTHVRTAVADGEGCIEGRLDETTDHSRGPDSVIAQVTRLAGQSLAQSGVTKDAIERVAVASPGPVDIRTGVVHSPPNMPGWDDVPLRARLQEALGRSVMVENDANAGAIGELHFGAARGARNAVYITVSTGIGGGVIEDGRLVEGASGAAGEIGHMTIDLRGELCKCGNIGCLEMLASGTAIGRRFQRALDEGRQSIASEWLSGRPARAEDAVRAAEQGDPTALEVLTDSAEALGVGVVNALHLFNPEVVILGGGVMQAGPLIFEPVRRMVDRYTMGIPRRDARIVPAELGQDVGLIGAVAIAVFGRGS